MLVSVSNKTRVIAYLSSKTNIQLVQADGNDGAIYNIDSPVPILLPGGLPANVLVERVGQMHPIDNSRYFCCADYEDLLTANPTEREQLEDLFFTLPRGTLLKEPGKFGIRLQHDEKFRLGKNEPILIHQKVILQDAFDLKKIRTRAIDFLEVKLVQ